jgi:hypothetical protein
MTRDDSDWLRGTEALLAQPLPLDHQIQLRYALGKYFDDIAEYPQAFHNYRAANELAKRRGTIYDRAGLTALIERIVQRCDSAFVQAAARAASQPATGDSERPVFIIGMARSGTSLAEQILASHPAVFGVGEVRFWDRAFTELDRAAAARDGRADVFLGELAREYLDQVSPPAGVAARITDKMPANFLYAGLIHRVFPRARIVHMQRDPRDTCLSAYFQNFFYATPYANDLSDLAHYYGEYQRIMSHWRGVLPEHVLLEVPYEGLVQDPERWTRRMLEFIGLPWDPQCLSFDRTERVVLTASKWQVRQKISTGPVGRWRNYEQFLGPLLHLLPDGH